MKLTRPLWIVLRKKDGYSKKVSYPFPTFRPYYEEMEPVWLPGRYDGLATDNVCSPVIHHHFEFKEWLFDDTALYEEA